MCIAQQLETILARPASGEVKLLTSPYVPRGEVLDLARSMGVLFVHPADMDEVRRAVAGDGAPR